MVLISNPRESVPLMAQSSFKKKVIGDAARMLKASKYNSGYIYLWPTNDTYLIMQ